MYKFLKITRIEDTKEARNGRNYRQIWLKPISTLPNGQNIFSNQKEISRLLWDAFTDDKGNKFTADSLFTSIAAKEVEIGSLVEGSIQRFDTYTYRIDQKEVNSITMVIFSNEDGITIANKHLKQHKSCVVIDGALTCEDNLKETALTV